MAAEIAKGHLDEVLDIDWWKVVVSVSPMVSVRLRFR